MSFLLIKREPAVPERPERRGFLRLPGQKDHGLHVGCAGEHVHGCGPAGLVAKAREELKKETVNLASAMTEKLLREHLTPEERDKLLQQSMKEMEEAPWQKQK